MNKSIVYSNEIHTMQQYIMLWICGIHKKRCASTVQAKHLMLFNYLQFRSANNRTTAKSWPLAPLIYQHRTDCDIVRTLISAFDSREEISLYDPLLAMMQHKWIQNAAEQQSIHYCRWTGGRASSSSILHNNR